ncbi:DUF4907 domain-containing protein [Aquimarina sp. MMG016]|uniref:DUF4907 domain-containing protein n=1 Tax=Aquimarina sp. MMG016 TaxID=2822690 RepID=UPI001B39E06A|nr:DUF4907 domain-containing protein [Aquimarina sp. MMG016]MBQ4819427.1 DUF4907 domain-containing protein [Aquimarina sp. MMG016]
MKKVINYIMIFSTILLGVLLINSFIKHEIKKVDLSTYSIKVKELSDQNGWYYEIYNGNQLLIKQYNIPGVSGNQYFRTRTDAEKIGKLVVQKLEQKTMPAITRIELQSRNIYFEN